MPYNYCPHCGEIIGQNQVAGQMLTCTSCGKQIGVVADNPQKPALDPAEESIRQGRAGRCPACGQAVEVKGPARTFVPHYAAGLKKMCPGSGKPSATAPASPSPAPAASPTPAMSVKMPGGRDLSKYYTRDLIRVILYRKGVGATIEELTLEYLDKADRVRIQIEALREILGPSFRMKDYPPSLGRTYLAVWGNADACVVAKKHERGGYEPMNDAEIPQIIGQIAANETLFLGA